MRDSRPNIVLVVLDSARRDHLSAYGYERRTTPDVERIAEEGVLFANAYAASCWTIPAHASLFTGLLPSEHRADFDTRRLESRHLTLATYLKRQGYRTGCISCNGFISEHTRLNAGFDVSIDVGRLRGRSTGVLPRIVRGVHRRWRDLTARDRGARRATRLASRWLEEQAGDDPFFLFLNYMECHLPYRLQGPARYRFVAPDDRTRVDSVPQDPFAAMAGGVTLTRQSLTDLQALYDGALHFLDRQVGILDARLRQLGLDDRTLFIVTSDHGESFGEHGLLDHQYGLYEHLIAVPLIMRLPGRERAGETHGALVQHTDILPTLAQWLSRGRFDGYPAPRSGRPIFGGPPRESVVAEYLVPNVAAIRRRFPQADLARFDVPMRAIRDERYKLIRRRDGGAELYDLSTDPGERRNLINGRPDLVGRLEAELESLVGAWPALEQQPVDERGFTEVRERLEALGYL